jgi:hypothetical protein
MIHSKTGRAFGSPGGNESNAERQAALLNVKQEPEPAIIVDLLENARVPHG